MLYASDSDIGDMIETLPATVPHPFKLCFNHDYLDMVLGVWPLVMHYTDSDSAVIFEPQMPAGECAPWRFVLMPVRGGFEDVDKVLAAFDAEMYPEWGSGE